MQLDCVVTPGPPSLLLSLATASSPVLELQTGPTDFLCLLEISASVTFGLQQTAAYDVGLGVPAARGVGFNPSPFAVENSELTDALPGCQLYTQWTKAPTAPANYLRRMVTNPWNGGSVMRKVLNFRFPQGLKIGPSSSLVLFLLSSTTNISFVYDVGLVVED